MAATPPHASSPAATSRKPVVLVVVLLTIEALIAMVLFTSWPDGGASWLLVTELATYAMSLVLLLFVLFDKLWAAHVYVSVRMFLLMCYLIEGSDVGFGIALAILALAGLMASKMRDYSVTRSVPVKHADELRIRTLAGFLLATEILFVGALAAMDPEPRNIIIGLLPLPIVVAGIAVGVVAVCATLLFRFWGAVVYVSYRVIVGLVLTAGLAFDSVAPTNVLIAALLMFVFAEVLTRRVYQVQHARYMSQ
ncbi:hypothetical protein IEU95_09390 [Hoyosella rhizosphaerae]|uniref:Uncharacterized protein n=1 Tax=Hoyosella rhizosphaerae TaxID=1755582 RepID=A0A916U147_9ACTN|nr:hypothetical protein [Hoyosella rhizosphaerae]MBN4927045.1 hypothetical protein [Hoyosella rhizosphaerae]GGC54478.1 hypothetical protein GCM10011410_03560 [Hoyosella rhizosphaerae]